MYWNINNKNIASQISELIIEKEVDILVLSEIDRLDKGYLRSLLNKEKFVYDFEEVLGSKRICFFHNLIGKIHVIDEKDHYSAFKIETKQLDILLIAVHLESLLGRSQDSLDSNLFEYSLEFRKIEDRVGHQNTIILGDFNMNPFSNGIINVKTLNAVMSPKIAEKKERKVGGKKYNYYYNPTWNILGKNSNGVMGTYYYNGDNLSYYWNAFDQVLIRPSLIGYFDVNKLEIVSSSDKIDLLTKNGLPNKRLLSDHLPLMFNLCIGGYDE